MVQATISSIIIDEFTGRMMEGRRFSEGLHQALEAKEGVTVQAGEPDPRLHHLPELFPASIPSSSGMTGTAMTEADEFAEIYKLEDDGDPDQRRRRSATDEHDEVYRTAAEKYNAVATADRRGAPGCNQPVLVGTTSIEKSELISEHSDRTQGRAARGAERPLQHEQRGGPSWRKPVRRAR